MAFLKKIFGKKDPLTALADAYRQKAWADVVNIAADLEPTALDQSPEHQSMLEEARSTLAEMNLREARTRFSQGDSLAGREHLALARQYGASEGALAEAGPAEKKASGDLEKPSRTASETSGCQDCGEDGDMLQPERAVVTEDLDLLLTGLPEELISAYRAKSEQFLQALQLAYAGMDAEACEAFSRLPESEKDVHFHFEYGAALGRLGRNEEAVQLFCLVLDKDCTHRSALEALFDLNLAGQAIAGLEERLACAEQDSRMVGFAAACRTRLAWHEGDGQAVLRYGEAALAEGEGGGEVVQMMAVVYEGQKNYERAEQLLGQLSGGGCGGGVHPLLAEFWLRQSRHLDRALEAFKGAARNEPHNPRWALRIGQTYLGRGWRKDGIKVLNRLAESEGLPEDLRAELNSAIENA